MGFLLLIQDGFGLVLNDLFFGLVKSYFSMGGLLGKEVVVFVEVDLDLRQGGRFC